MLDSPVRKVRESLSLSVVELATGAGVQPGQITLCERGATPIPARVGAFLEAMPGVNLADLTRDHLQFRLRASEEIRSRVLSGRGGTIPAAHKMVSGACNK